MATISAESLPSEGSVQYDIHSFIDSNEIFGENEAHENDDSSHIVTIADNITMMNDTVMRGFHLEPIPKLAKHQPDFFPDIVITIMVIAGCVAVGVGIAKLSNAMYGQYIRLHDKRRQQQQTKNKLLARATIMTMKETLGAHIGEEGHTAEKSAKHMAVRWMGRASVSHIHDEQEYMDHLTSV